MSWVSHTTKDQHGSGFTDDSAATVNCTNMELMHLPR